eukprot:Lankesteria_metandrocarpae@DN5052_c0_g1_i1.p1
MERTNIPEPFVWNYDFEIGHHQSNVDNAFLFSLVRKLASDEANAHLTQKFVETLKTIFSRKEATMQKHNYSECAAYTCAHQVFLEDLDEVVVKQSKQSGLTLGSKGSVQKRQSNVSRRSSDRQLHRKETQKYERHRSKSVSRYYTLEKEATKKQTLERAATRKKISRKSILSKLRRKSKESDDVSDEDASLPDFIRNDLRRNTAPQSELGRRIERRKSERQVLFDINFSVQQNVLYVNKLKDSDILFVKNWIVGHIMHAESHLKDVLFGGKLASLHAKLDTYDWSSAHEADDIDELLEELDSVPTIADYVPDVSSPIGSVQLTDVSTCCGDSVPVKTLTKNLSRKETGKKVTLPKKISFEPRKLESEPKSILRKPSLRKAAFNIPERAETSVNAVEESSAKQSPKKTFLRRPTKFIHRAFDTDDSSDSGKESDGPVHNTDSQPVVRTAMKGMRKAFNGIPPTVGVPTDDFQSGTDSVKGNLSSRLLDVSDSTPQSYRSDFGEKTMSSRRSSRNQSIGKSGDQQTNFHQKTLVSVEGKCAVGPPAPPLSPIVIPHLTGGRMSTPTLIRNPSEQRSQHVSPLLVRNGTPPPTLFTRRRAESPSAKTSKPSKERAPAQIAPTPVPPITFSALFNADVIVMASQGPWPTDDTKLRIKMLKVCQVVSNFGKRAVPIVLATPSFCQLTEQDPWQLCGCPLMSLANASISGYSSNDFIAAVNSLASAQHNPKKVGDEVVDTLPKSPVFPIQIRKERCGVAMVCVVHIRVLSRRRKLLVASVADISNLSTFDFQDESVVECYQQIVRSSLGSKDFERVVKKFMSDSSGDSKLGRKILSST